jgi:hypothetical protein
MKFIFIYLITGLVLLSTGIIILLIGVSTFVIVQGLEEIDKSALHIPIEISLPTYDTAYNYFKISLVFFVISGIILGIWLKKK